LQFLINFNNTINGYTQGLAANGYLNKKTIDLMLIKIQ